MKLQPDKSNAPTINAYGHGWVEVDGVQHTRSVVVSSIEELPSWSWAPAQFQNLTIEDFQCLAQEGVELVILGSGHRLQFAAASLMAPLINRGIGLECMDTPAACRTYNILASEGRKVLAAILIES
jgi:uncharacterized protein